MKRPHPGASAAGGEKFHEAVFLLEAGDVLQQLGGLLDIKRLEVLGLEKTKKWTCPIGKILHQSLRGSDDGDSRVLLNEGPELFLPGITETFKNGVEILGRYQEG